MLRQIQTASKHYDVVVVGEGQSPPSESNITYNMLPESSASRPLFKDILKKGLGLLVCYIPGLRQTRIWPDNKYLFAYRKLCNAKLDLIHINDFIALPSGIAAAKDSGALAVFDAHEYSLGQKRQPPLRSWIFTLIAFFILHTSGKKADAYITVSEGIAELYRKKLGYDPTVIMNAPEKNIIRKKSFDPEKIRIVHHGLAAPQRNLELLIEVASRLDPRYSLHFILVGDPDGYLCYLKGFAAEHAADRVHFHSPVTPNQLANVLSQFDIGIHLLLNDVPNHEYALPNKFFDFIAAGLPVVIGPSTEMAQIVRRYDLGIVSPSFDPKDIASILNDLSSTNIKNMSDSSLVASDYLNSEIEMKRLSDIYFRLLGEPIQS